MNCHIGGKQEQAVGLVSSKDRLDITHAVCGYPGDGQRWPLTADGGAQDALKTPDKEGDASTVQVVR